jgi:hypothetical protein
LLEGAKCKINLTILISSSSYPKNIYNMSLDEIGVETKFGFETKFKFGLKSERKDKRKEEKKEAQTLMGWPRAKKAHIPLPGPSGKPTRLGGKKK